MTEEFQGYSESELAKIRVLKKVAIGVGSVVALIFMVAAVFGYYHVRYDRPAKHFFTDQPVPEGVRQ